MKSKFDHSFFNKSFKFMPVVDLCWVIYTNITSWLVNKSEVGDKILVYKANFIQSRFVHAGNITLQSWQS